MIVSQYSNIYKEDSTLRHYQQKAKKEIFESWDEVDNVMFQMPTGTGKTRLFTSIIRDINDYSILHREPVKILIIAHRTELIDQIDGSLDKYKVPHNVIAGGRDRNYKYPVSVASIQTITHPNNLKDAKKLNVQFVIIDEAHHALATTYKKLWDLYPGSKKLGVTATPWRMNHKGFLGLFNKLVLSMPIKDFIKQGYLAPYKYFSLRSDSDIQSTIDDIELDKFGEYKESSMEEKMDIGSIRAQLLDSYLSLAEGKKGIIYAINIVHAKHICKEYEKAGYKAVSIDSKTPAGERKELVDKFRKGEIDIIVNVDIFSEGFDCPDIEFIQLARPTRSLVKYLQQVGRGLRPTANKANCIILDNVGMYSRFGLPNARRHWKQHFIGKNVTEEPTISIFKGTGRSRNVDMSEGTEDMELIQDVYEDVEPTIEAPVLADNKEDEFDPILLLEANNYLDNNFVFWFKENKTIYDAYIQDDMYYIISELLIDEKHHCVHRKRVGKIPMESWMFWQMEREKVDNLQSIVHYGANYTVFHYRVLSADNTRKDKHFDYKGREIDSPSVVENKFDQANKERHISDYIDVPVSKAKFTSQLKSNRITIFRTLKGITKPIAIFSVISDFGKHYYYDSDILKRMKREMGVQRLGNHNSDDFSIIRSDHNSFTVRCTVDDIMYLYKYDLKGSQVKKVTIAGVAEVAKEKEKNKKISLPTEDIDKLHHVFDSKATSYKYFWFMSFLQLYKETKNETIYIRKILVRMIANAWKYVFIYNSKFSLADQLPKYLQGIQSITKLQKNSGIAKIEKEINQHANSSNLNSLMMPLLKNVPYRFLSPWIPFINNDDVIRKSGLSDTRCLYKLDNTHITINALWKSYLLENYREIADFINDSLDDYLKVDSNGKSSIDFYDIPFLSLSQLLKEMRSRKNVESVMHFLDKFNLPTNRKLSPADILERIPKSKYTIDSKGNKKLSVREGQWSLKVLEKLLSEN